MPAGVGGSTPYQTHTTLAQPPANLAVDAFTNQTQRVNGVCCCRRFAGFNLTAAVQNQSVWSQCL